MEDYEASNAQEWNLDIQTTGDAPHARLPLHLQNARPIERKERIVIKAAPPKTATKLVRQNRILDRNGKTQKVFNAWSAPFAEEDNEARASWRRKQPATGNFELPNAYGQIYASTFLKSPPGRKPFSVKYSVLEQIGSKTGAFIEPPRRYSDRLLLIWGSLEKVTAAKEELVKWVQRFKYTTVHNTDGGRSAFGKVLAISEKRKKQLAKQMEDDASRQMYKQAPGNTEAFRFIGYFQWPVEEVRPESILGKSFEAFDPIRMVFRCYILFEQKHAVFKVLSATPNELDAALSRIRGTLCEIMTRSNRPASLYIVTPPALGTVRAEVELVEKKMGDNGSRGVVPRLTGPRLSKNDLSTWESLRPKLAAANAKHLAKTLLDCLRMLRYYRGHISMRVLFGTLVLSSYRKAKSDRHGLMEFLDMMRCAQVAGELGKESPQHCEKNSDLLSRCCTAESILEPADAMTNGLENVQPVFSATFEVTDPSIHETFRLDLEFHKAVDVDGFEISSKKWFKIFKESSKGFRKPISRNVPLSVKSLNIERDAAWQLEVTADNSVDISRITPEMREFADWVKLSTDAPLKVGTSSPLVTFKKVLEVHSFMERRSFRYMMKGSTYVFEVAEGNIFFRGDSSNGQKWVCQRSEQAATLYNREWDTIFGQNASLGIGEAASWIDSVDTFFPREGSRGSNSAGVGLSDLVRRVETISELINDANTSRSTSH